MAPSARWRAAAAWLLLAGHGAAAERRIVAYVIEDSMNHRVQRCPAEGGACATVVGGRGRGSLPDQLAFPMDVVVASDGAYVVADTMNHRVLRCSAAANGPCATVAGGRGRGSALDQLAHPRSVAFDPQGNYIIADQFNHRILRCPADGTGLCAVVVGERGELSNPGAVHLADDGSFVVADRGNQRIARCWMGAGGEGDDKMACITVAGGNGQGRSEMQFHNPLDVVLAANGDYVVADNMNHRVQRCPAVGFGNCTTVAGGYGRGFGNHQLAFPRHVAIASNGDFVVTDKLNHRVQRCPASGAAVCATVAGGRGDGAAADQLSYPDGVFLVEAEVLV